MHPAIAQHRASIDTICQCFNISRLEVLGSAARADDFNPATSDVDFLIEFRGVSQSVNPRLRKTRTHAQVGAKQQVAALQQNVDF